VRTRPLKSVLVTESGEIRNVNHKIRASEESRTRSRQISDQNDITPASPESPIWTGPHLCSFLQSLLPKIFRPEWHKPDIRNGVGIGTNGQKVRAHLIEIKHQVQLADIIKKGVCFLYKPPGQPSILIGRPNAPRISTNRCMASRYASSLSFASTHTQKKRPA
jgi:hypothetical protein